MARTRSRFRRQLRKRGGSAWWMISLIVVAALLMLIHVTLRVRVNELAQEVDQLQRQRRALLEERQTLFQRVEELSSFGRIHQMAKTELDLVFPSTETVGAPSED